MTVVLDGPGVTVSDVVAVARHRTEVRFSDAARSAIAAARGIVGASGSRPQVAESLLGLVNAGVVPAVPEHGSLGASGNLAPLAHAALVLIGEGEVLTDDGARLTGPRPCRRRGSSPWSSLRKRAWLLPTAPTGSWECSAWLSTISPTC